MELSRGVLLCQQPVPCQEKLTTAKNKKKPCMPLTPISDQDRISLYNIKQTSDENKEKYQHGNN